MNSLFESRIHNNVLLVTLLALVLGSVARAEPGKLRLAGFGTLGLGCFSADNADFVPDAFRPDGVGRSDDCNLNTDSILGVQLSGEIHDRLGFDVQLTSKYNYDGNYRPQLSLGLLNFAVNDQTRLRLGRSTNPNFLYSETRNVHFTMPWTRPPTELYSLSPVLEYNGIDVLHKLQLDDWDTEFHFGASVSNPQLPPSADGSSNKLESWQLHGNFTLERDDWLVKLGYSGGEYTLQGSAYDALLNGLVAPVDASLARDLAVDGSVYHLLAAGITYQDNDWQVQGELGGRTVDSLSIRDTLAAYLSVSRHMGAWTPYAAWSERWSRGKSDQRADRTPIEATIDALLSTSTKTRTLTLGVARALGNQAMVKLQVDRIEPKPVSNGGFANRSPAYDTANPDTEWLFSLNLDFVF